MKRYSQAPGGVMDGAALGDWVYYGDAQAVIDRLQALLNERDDQVSQLGQVLGEVLVAAGMIHGDAPLTGPQLLQFGREFCESAAKPRDDRAEFEAAWAARRKELRIAERGNEFYRVQPNDLYRWSNVQDAWEMWQARAALK